MPDETLNISDGPVVVKLSFGDSYNGAKMAEIVATAGRHRIVQQDDRYFIWTEGVGYWGFDFRTLDAAKDAAKGVE